MRRQSPRVRNVSSASVFRIWALPRTATEITTALRRIATTERATERLERRRAACRTATDVIATFPKSSTMFPICRYVLDAGLMQPFAFNICTFMIRIDFDLSIGFMHDDYHPV